MPCCLSEKVEVEKVDKVDHEPTTEKKIMNEAVTISPAALDPKMQQIISDDNNSIAHFEDLQDCVNGG